MRYTRMVITEKYVRQHLAVRSSYRQGHVGRDENVESHIKLAPRDQIGVGNVALHHVRLRSILLRLLPPAVGLPLADLT